jgi:hypothetical protein
MLWQIMFGPRQLTALYNIVAAAMTALEGIGSDGIWGVKEETARTTPCGIRRGLAVEYASTECIPVIRYVLRSDSNQLHM